MTGESFSLLSQCLEATRRGGGHEEHRLRSLQVDEYRADYTRIGYEPVGRRPTTDLRKLEEL